jgi:hypothetical protein
MESWVHGPETAIVESGTADEFFEIEPTTRDANGADVVSFVAG